jgi:large subunit ribosomal protein L20
MPRAKTGVVRRRRHKKILEATKGYRGSRSKLFRNAYQAFIRAGEHAFAGRKLKKRDMRSLWIIRINAALAPMNIRYSQFIKDLNSSKLEIDRKVLSELAVNQPEAFKAIVEKVSAK